MAITIRMATCTVLVLALVTQALASAAADQGDISFVPGAPNPAGCVSLSSPSSLAGDVNGDGFVNVGDLQLLVASWAKAFGDPGFNTEADFNCDAYVNVGDLQLLVFNWGAHL